LYPRRPQSKTITTHNKTIQTVSDLEGVGVGDGGVGGVGVGINGLVPMGSCS